ncbi:hypothetical protein [Methylobacterium sp. J-070]|uniref:hypothetical protein n=1 Tax=Methylobacterium sp. J-070 TaxID=2836650 RepID=UPI001FBA0EE0|nr:hypothetical protein [Methylobacterium sp. J-070]MCJ2054769.1 hypothetical protein [Methylobacterium sp. J-070]
MGKAKPPIHAVMHVSERSDSAEIINSDYRIHYANSHLCAAIHFHKAVDQIESINAGKEYGEFWVVAQYNAVACVLTAVAAVEAYANEIYADREQIFGPQAADQIDEMMRICGRSMRTLDTIAKLELFLRITKNTEIDHARDPYRSICALVELRNAVVHFKPEPNSHAPAHEALSKKLRSCIKPGPFIRANNEALFPRRWISASSTKWAVMTAISFVREYEKLAGIPDKFFGIEGKV